MTRPPLELVISVPDAFRAAAADLGAVATATLRWLAVAGGPPVNAVGGELAEAEQPSMCAQVLAFRAAWASVAVAPSNKQALSAGVAATQAARTPRRDVSG